MNHGRRAAKLFALFAGVNKTRADALAEDLALELSEHGEQSSHRAPGWGSQIECLC
jgi:hypothetical protein